MIECPNCRFLVDAGSTTCRFCGGAVATPVFATAGVGGAPSSAFHAPRPASGFPAPGDAPVGLPGAATPFPYPAYGAPGGGSAKPKAVVPIAVGVLVVLVVASLAVFALSGGDDAYPAAWDPQVQPLVDFVERERGLAFDHPVHVEFRAEESFRASTVPEPPTDAEKAENAKYSAFYRALGLVSGAFDLAATGTSMTGDAALAYYDFHTKRITVRGESLDDGTKPTLVHELTHALQDQHFDLRKLHEELDADQMEGLDAVVEGDAERIEARYEEQQDGSAGTGEVVKADETDGAAHEGSVYDNYPPTLVALFTAPYALGHPLVDLLEQFGGPGAIDDAIMDPPHSSEYMMDPFEFINGHDPVAVPTPSLASGEVGFDEGSFGPLGLFLVLQERLGGKAALHAADTWGGDRYVTFERDNTVCARVDIRGDTPEAQQELVAALRAWRDRMPAGSVTVTAGEHARFEACDPGAAATFAPSPDGEYDRLVLPGIRSSFAANAFAAGQDKAFVRCVSRALVERAPMSMLIADDPGQAAIDAEIDAAVASCN